MTQWCNCAEVPFLQSTLLQADEHWHCLKCGWPVPADHWRVKHELEFRRCRYRQGCWCRQGRCQLAAMGRGEMSPRELLETINAAADAETELWRRLRRGRRIAIAGLICSMVLLALSLANLFGLLGHSLLTSFTIGVGTSFGFTLAYYNYAYYRRARRGL